MAIDRKKKEKILTILKDRFGKAKSIVFATNKGLSVKEIQEMRHLFQTQDVTFMVAKKTLIGLASKDIGIDLKIDDIPGAVGVACSSDEIASCRSTVKFAQKNEKLEVVGGILDGELTTIEKIKALALLPSRDELLAKVVGSMSAPIRGFVTVSDGVVHGFVQVLKQLQEQKQ